MNQAITEETKQKPVESKIETMQDFIYRKLNRIHQLVCLINKQKNHIIFYNVSGHVDSIRVSIRNKDNYKLVIMDIESYYSIDSTVEGFTNVDYQNVINRLEAIEKVLTVVAQRPNIETMSDIIANVDDDLSVILDSDFDFPF